MKFQRNVVIEGQDVTDSSDDLSEMFTNPDEKKGKMIRDAVEAELLKFSEGKLEKIDQALLRGFYSAHRHDLHGSSFYPNFEETQIKSDDVTDRELIQGNNRTNKVHD